MNTTKLNRFIVVVPAALCIVLAGCSKAYMDHRVVASGPVSEPMDVVESFYSSYASFPGNPMIDRVYQSDEHLTPELIQKVDAIIASFDKGGYDPFLCAQDVPGEFAFDDAVVSGEEATVVVHEVWNPGTEYEFIHDVTVALRSVGGQWKINDVICPGPEATDPLPGGELLTTPGQAVQVFYGWYIWYAREVGSPLADGAYRSSEYLTPQLVERVDEIIATFDKGGYDPFLCAQDLPESFTLDEAVFSGDTARLVVHTSFEGHTFTVELQQVAGQWKISDVLCGGEEENDLGVEGWQVLTDEAYGFALRFPEDWTYEEGQLPLPEERADGEKALQRVLFLQPQGWDGVAPPLHVQVTDGTQEEFGRLYVPPTSVEQLEINGLAVAKEVEDIGGVRVTRYIFQSSTDETVRVVALDYISGFPERAEGNDAVMDTLRHIVQTITFTQ